MKYVPEDGTFYLEAEKFLFYRDSIWFSDIGCNELYSYNIRDFSIKMVCKFVLEEEYQWLLFDGMIPVDDKLYLLPFSARRMYEVDIITGEARGIDIILPDCEYRDTLEDLGFTSGHYYKGRIFIMGMFYPGIVEYDCETGEQRCHDGWADDFIRLNQGKQGEIFLRSILDGNKIYAPACFGNYVMEFDLETKKHVFHEVGGWQCKYRAICRAGDWYWMAPRGDGPVVKWNAGTGRWKEYADYPDTYKSGSFGFTDIVYFQDHIYCIPFDANMVIRVDEKAEVLEPFFSMPEKPGDRITAQCLADQGMYLFISGRNRFAVYDSSGVCESKALVMPKAQSDYHKIYSSRAGQVLRKGKPLGERELLFESYPKALEDYLVYLCSGKQPEADGNVDGTDSIGREIYKRTVLETV